MPKNGSTLPESTDRVLGTIHEVVELEQREKVRMGASEHLADAITAFAGSMVFVWMNAIWYLAWIGAHIVGLVHFDPFPFSLLTMIVSLEAIGLAIFVLISQNRQAILADKRAKLDLQVNLIAESEVTKLVEMVERIESRLGISRSEDPDVALMKAPTHVGAIADKMEELERATDKEAAKGPSSAADTET